MILLLLPGKVGAGEIPFSAQSEITVGADGAFSAFLGDVDGDGDLDTLSASYYDDTIAWYENTAGDGSAWTVHVISTVADGASSVFAADVDEDGDLDALSASAVDDKIAWYENTAGDGSLWTERVIGTAGTETWGMYAADLDGDGDLDALSASWGGFEGDINVVWYENTAGDGSAWTQHTISNQQRGAFSVFAADVDGDGDLDALCGSEYNGKIAWYENTAGDGSAWTQHTITTAVFDALGIFAADVDGDGDLDALGADHHGDTFAWFENTSGDGTSWTSRIISAAADGASSVHATDLDRDGDLDVLTTSLDDDTVGWFENTIGDGSAWTEHTISTLADVALVALAADVNGDGNPDVVSVSVEDDKIAWYENTTIHRRAVYPSETTITTSATATHSLVAADLDGDGDVDALGASTNDNEVTWYQNTAGDASAWSEHAISVNPDQPVSVHAADIDGDGDLDALSTDSDNKVIWHENETGDASIWTDHTVTTDVDGPLSVFAADVDGDGDQDVLSASHSDDKIAWYENTAGNGSAWTGRTISTSADGAFSVFAADVDGDGDVDAVSASQSDGKIAWYENLAGDGSSWSAHSVSTDAGGARAVFCVDVDRDGDVDLLSASGFDDKVAWYENTASDGSDWAEHVISTALAGAVSVYAMDADRDGDPDVLAAGSGGGVSWYENTAGNGSAWTEHTIPTAVPWKWPVCAADLDRDGDPDVLSATWLGYDVDWYGNCGGQYAFATADTAPTTLGEGQRDDLLSITVAHTGRPGDTDLELASLQLLFEETAGAPLTTTEANSLIERIEIHLDDGSGVFEDGLDTPVMVVDDLLLAAGNQTVAFVDGDPNCQVAYGSPKAYFVVVELTEDANIHPAWTFRVTHVAESGSVAEDRDHDIPLAVECATNVSSSLVSVPEVDDPIPTEVIPATETPLTVDKTVSGDLVLSWSAACPDSDRDNGIYEGQIGDFASHSIKTCSTGGATTATITPGEGDRYYLVVPQSPNREGSYGYDSAGTPRPQAVPACLPQVNEADLMCPQIGSFDWHLRPGFNLVSAPMQPLHREGANRYFDAEDALEWVHSRLVSPPHNVVEPFTLYMQDRRLETNPSEYDTYYRGNSESSAFAVDGVHGYWIYLNIPGDTRDFVINFEAVDYRRAGTNTVVLEAGWNLLGFTHNRDSWTTVPTASDFTDGTIDPDVSHVSFGGTLDTIYVSKWTGAAWFSYVVDVGLPGMEDHDWEWDFSYSAHPGNGFMLWVDKSVALSYPVEY